MLRKKKQFKGHRALSFRERCEWEYRRWMSSKYAAEEMNGVTDKFFKYRSVV